jgi:hypothetical protein
MQNYAYITSHKDVNGGDVWIRNQMKLLGKQPLGRMKSWDDDIKKGLRDGL